MSDGTQGSRDLAAEVSVKGPTTVGEDRAQADAKRFRVVAIVAGALFAPTVIGHLAMPFIVMPTFKSMFESMGGSLPAPTAFLLAMGPWLGILLLAIDGLVFWGFAKLARKYWIGLLFAPLFATGLLTAPIVWALYMPMFEVINLVK
jgi:type II secretory pathway component PulF